MGKKCCSCARFCMGDAARAIGLAVLAFNIGLIAGKFCPFQIIAVIQLAVLSFIGYLCLFKW